MKSDIVIRAERLGKKYLIGHQRQRESYVALRDVVSRNARNAAKKTWDLMRGLKIAGSAIEEFWALKDVSFEVRRGEVLAIIGRNGAGKSTLLKILSRITEPSAGRVTVKGRVASLLEVGTGFHPELTGRENIYLNGAILGMRRAEIKRKFDEIVAFAEVEKFLDTPVKRYSSGMYVRLAFAVAAHLDSEILVIDEILAVGDLEFQKRCLGKIDDVAHSGRTVLFVSHNIQAVADLCNHGLVLERGKVLADRAISEAIAAYTSHVSGTNMAGHVLFDRGDSPVFGDGAVTKVEMLDASGAPATVLTSNAPAIIRVHFTATTAIPRCSLILQIRSVVGTVLVKLESNPNRTGNQTASGVHRMDCRIDNLPLAPGQYLVGVAMAIRGVRLIDWIEDAGMVTIVASNDPALEAAAHPEGVVAIRHEWQPAEQMAVR